MRVIRKLFLAIIFVLMMLALSACALIFLSLEQAPRPGPSASTANSMESIPTLEQLAQASNNGLLTLRDQELAELIKLQLRRANVESALSLSFDDGRASAALSIALPFDVRRKYLNVSGLVIHSAPPEHISVQQLTLGTLALPAKAIEFLSPYMLKLCKRDDRCKVGLETYKNIDSLEFSNGRVEVRYALGAETLEQLGASGIKVDELNLEPYFAALNDLAKLQGRKPVDLHLTIQSVFQLAQQRSTDASAIEENAAALMALAIQNAKPKMRNVLFRTSDPARQLLPLKIQAHDRRDLAHHFINSTALFLIGGSDFGNYIGVYKEFFDASVGKKFDFSDIASDRAGVRFARFATASEHKAQELQQRVLAINSSAEYLPSKKIIDELHLRSARNATQKINTIFPEIDKALAQLPLLN